MQVYEGLPALTTFLTSPNPSTTVAIGAFDGIHTGHQAIIRTAVDDARAHDRPAIVFTFDRHPAELLRPDRAPDYITTPEQRIQLIEQLDADAMVIAQFDTALSILSPEEFVRDILVGLLGAKTLVIGADFCFGQNRAGM